MSTEDTRNMSVNPEPEELSEDNLNELRKIRREKLKNLQDAGRNPFLLENGILLPTAWISKIISTPWKIRKYHAQEG